MSSKKIFQVEKQKQKREKKEKMRMFLKAKILNNG